MIHLKRIRAHILEKKPTTYRDALQVALDESAIIIGENITSSGNGHIDQMEIGAIDAKTATCHYCKAVGHFAANCYKKNGGPKKPTFSTNGGTQKIAAIKRPYPNKAGSARPPAKQYRKKPWGKKATFKRFIKELAEAINEDGEEEVLQPEEDDEENAHQEIAAETGFFYSKEEDHLPEEEEIEESEIIADDIDAHF